MKDYTNNTPEFNHSIAIAEETDPGHADIINAAPKQLLENTLVLKSEIDTLDENIRKSGLLDNAESGGGEESSNRLDAMQGDIEALQVPEFEESHARENINPGDSQETLWGKVKKWFSDLKSGAFASIVNNCTTTEEGTVLDGRQGKALQDQITELREAEGEINSNMGGVRFGIDANGNYGYKKAGADTVIPFKSLNLIETSGSIPAGVKKALCISASVSDSTKADVRISGSIITSSRQRSFLNMIVSGKYTAGAVLTELELSGAAGTITVNFTAGAGTQRTGYALFYLK